MKDLKALQSDAIELLQQLISIPSMSKSEDVTADAIAKFLSKRDIRVNRIKNNVWAVNRNFDPAKPSILLNSHHDTVKPNAGYTRDPFSATIEDGVLYGLGSNDAGGCLVSLIAAFLNFHDDEKLNYNLVLLASAEEEISGRNGVELAYPELPKIDFAIVGEPTEMNAAIAEKGLMVLDCLAKGESGHAAREEGVNALYKAIECINWFRSFEFPKKSESLGDIKMSVTVIESGTQHNVVPDTCKFTVDVRVTDAYSNEEVLGIIRDHVSCDVVPRSTRLNSSSIGLDHPIVKSALEFGATTYGSPTMSDQALLPVPSLKMGPGKSERSHTGDEFILVKEIEEGIARYILVIDKVLA